jgi:hypothetical protein
VENRAVLSITWWRIKNYTETACIELGGRPQVTPMIYICMVGGWLFLTGTPQRVEGFRVESHVTGYYNYSGRFICE